MILFAALLSLAAVEVRRIPAAEANQGAAADRDAVFAIDNSTVARYDRRTGRRLAIWRGDPLRFRHLNSCSRRGGYLVCAGSNYPEVPMRSQVLWFDPRTLALRAVREIGGGEGSLTWLDRHRGAWWACFAHYDGKGGEPGRDHRATVLVRYDSAFVPRQRWRFPEAILARLAPRSASGGAWGRDGLLYVTGHDRPEIYVLQAPKHAPELRLVATIAAPTGGQAIGWDGRDARLLWSIDRGRRELVASRVPAVDPSARRR